MGKKIDMTGWIMKEHGVLESKLIVLYEEKNYAKINNLKVTNTYWRCKCECGNETIADRSSLMSGNTKSCGCLKKRKYFCKRFNE